MNTDEGGWHSKQVDNWIEKSAAGLTSGQLLTLFGEAIDTIQRRAATTLSQVTLTAVFDRVLYLSQQRYALLSDIKIDPAGTNMEGLVSHAGELEADEIRVAFRTFLIELLSLLGNLTADILTKPLYRDLFKVTAGTPNLRSVKCSSNRGNL